MSVDVTTYLDTPAKVDAAQLWFQWATNDDAGYAYIDCARLRLNG